MEYRIRVHKGGMWPYRVECKARFWPFWFRPSGLNGLVGLYSSLERAKSAIKYHEEHREDWRTKKMIYVDVVERTGSDEPE